MINNLDNVAKDLIQKEVDRVHKELDDLYDKAEGISAKVKLWVRLNKRNLLIGAGIAVLFFLIGLVC